MQVSVVYDDEMKVWRIVCKGQQSCFILTKSQQIGKNNWSSDNQTFTPRNTGSQLELHIEGTRETV